MCIKLELGIDMSAQKAQHSQFGNIVLAKKAAHFGFLTLSQRCVCLSIVDCPRSLRIKLLWLLPQTLRLSYPSIS